MPPAAKLAQIRSLFEQSLRGGDLKPEYRREAQTYLGMMLIDGRSGPMDPARARQLFTQSANAGWSPGDYGLGLIYRDGLGVPKDMTKALHHFDKAYETAEHFDAAFEAAKIRLSSRSQPFEVELAMEQLDHAGGEMNPDALVLMA